MFEYKPMPRDISDESLQAMVVINFVIMLLSALMVFIISTKFLVLVFLTAGFSILLALETRHRSKKLKENKLKNWKIEKNEFGYYEANKTNNSNEYYLFSKTVEGIKIEIDEMDE